MRPKRANQSVVERVTGTVAVASVVGITPQRVSQLEVVGVRKLWQRRARELLKQQQGR